MNKKSVNTLILDLDNTLYDWFEIWYANFNPIYEEILRRTGKPVAEIEAQIRKVHQAQRTSEYTFLIEELEGLADIRASGEIRSLFKDALEKSRGARDQAMRLYPSVFTALWRIKSQGTKIVGYTESMAFYSAYRLKRFGLDGLIDVLFSPKDHDVPPGASMDKIRTLPDEFYQLQVTEQKHTPPGELKPNPGVLLDIIKSVEASAANCAYVGDSIFKDVAMARDAGVYDIHAKYGESQRRPEYKLLQRVSHWTEADVERERAITANGHDFTPSATLTESFAEIFAFCDFRSFQKATGELTFEQESKNVIEVWKKAVDVQQHFNDLELRIRNMAVTVVGAALAALGFTYQLGLNIQIFGHHVSAGIGLVLAAIFAWLAFFLMDRYWYHVLLRGAVVHAGKIEQEYATRISGIGLGTTISKESQSVQLFCIKTSSNARVTIFYALGIALLLAVLIFVGFAEASAKKSAQQEPTPPTVQTQSAH